MRAATGTSRQSGRPSQSWLTERIESVGRRFNQELTTYLVKAYLKTWGEMVEQVGQGRFDTALQRCLVECGFFPTEQEIRQRIPRGSLEPHRCALCEDLDGWVKVEGGRVKRCQHLEATA